MISDNIQASYGGFTWSQKFKLFEKEKEQKTNNQPFHF